MSPGELFGFGLGSFSEKLAGQNSTSKYSKFPPWFVPILQDHMMSMIVPGVARSSGKDCVAWLLGTDADMVVCAATDGKKVLPLAEAGFDPVRLKDSSDTSFTITEYMVLLPPISFSEGGMWCSARLRDHGGPSLRL